MMLQVLLLLLFVHVHKQVPVLQNNKQSIPTVYKQNQSKPISKDRATLRKQLRKKKDLSLSDIYNDVPNVDYDLFQAQMNRLQEEDMLQQQQEQQKIQKKREHYMKKQYRQMLREQQNKVLNQLNTHYQFPLSIDNPTDETLSQALQKTNDNSNNQQSKVDVNVDPSKPVVDLNADPSKTGVDLNTDPSKTNADVNVDPSKAKVDVNTDPAKAKRLHQNKVHVGKKHRK